MKCRLVRITQQILILWSRKVTFAILVAGLLVFRRKPWTFQFRSFNSDNAEYFYRVESTLFNSTTVHFLSGTAICMFCERYAIICFTTRCGSFVLIAFEIFHDWCNCDSKRGTVLQIYSYFAEYLWSNSTQTPCYVIRLFSGNTIRFAMYCYDSTVLAPEICIVIYWGNCEMLL